MLGDRDVEIVKITWAVYIPAGLDLQCYQNHLGIANKQGLGMGTITFTNQRNFIPLAVLLIRNSIMLGRRDDRCEGCCSEIGDKGSVGLIISDLLISEWLLCSLFGRFLHYFSNQFTVRTTLTFI